MQRFDVVIIGSGQAAGPLATAFASAGRSTALLEREHVGGTCINEGCTPTKTMVASGRVAYLARRSMDYGVNCGPISIDMPRVRQRKRDIVDLFRNGSQRRIQSGAVELIFGAASFSGPESVQVRRDGGEPLEIEADTIVVNVGARPTRPPLDGLADVPSLDSTTIMELDQVPERLLVLGGGYVGLEFGHLFRRLGSQVTIVQRGPQLLGREDPDIADEVANVMREDGIEVLLKTEALRVRRAGDALQLDAKMEDGERTLVGSHLLVAIGRTPNSDTLNLSAAGIEVDRRGFIPVDERLATNVPGVYAVGDVKPGPAFTHISYDDFRILRTNLIDGGSATTTDRLVPYTVYIDPQLGRVGLTEQEARAQGGDVRVAKMPMSRVARALEVDESRGVIKAVVDAQSGQILGCAVLGIEGGEIMSMLEIAMMGGLPYTALRDAIFAHPTLAECLNNLFASLEP